VNQIGLSYLMMGKSVLKLCSWLGYFKSKREERYMERRRRHASRAAPEREGPREVEMLRENDFQPSDEDCTDDEYGRRV